MYGAKIGAKTAVIVTGFNHDAIYELTPVAIWSPINAFILGRQISKIAVNSVRGGAAQRLVDDGAIRKSFFWSRFVLRRKFRIRDLKVPRYTLR